MFLFIVFLMTNPGRILVPIRVELKHYIIGYLRNIIIVIIVTIITIILHKGNPRKIKNILGPEISHLLIT